VACAPLVPAMAAGQPQPIRLGNSAAYCPSAKSADSDNTPAIRASACMRKASPYINELNRTHFASCEEDSTLDAHITRLNRAFPAAPGW